MKWILFTGTWRLTNKEVEEDVRKSVREVITHGDGIVTGGATGVDFFAMDEALIQNPDCSRIKIVLPAFLEDYIKAVYENWCTPPITLFDIEKSTLLLRKIKNINPNSLIEIPNKTVTEKDFDQCNTEEVKNADAVYAFQVNKSLGTQKTVDEARSAGLPIILHKEYNI